jgi:Ser/Thr protein kinase RdoA (MazF antagonist)
VVVETEDTDRLSGLIDFGDMVRTPVACDVGVACAYHVLPADHPLRTVAEYVAAFHAVRPLTDAEIEVLPSLILARQITTIVISGRRALTHPGNAAYILRNRPLVAAGLAQLLPVSQDQAVEYLRSACR